MSSKIEALELSRRILTLKVQLLEFELKQQELVFNLTTLSGQLAKLVADNNLDDNFDAKETN